MHIAIKPIVKAFETLNNEFKKSKEDIIYLKTPIDQLKVPKINNRLKEPNKNSFPFLYKANGICEITTYDLTVETSLTVNTLRL